MAKKFMTYEALVDDYEVLRSLGIGGVLIDDDGNEIEASKGLICVKDTLMDSKAYKGKKNPNTWNMKAASSADTDVYFCAPQITDTGTNTNGNMAYFGANTLCITVPAGYPVRFEKAVPGFTYNLGSDNFSTAPDLKNGKKYATINKGLLVATDVKPVSGVYFEITKAVNFTEGTRAAGSGYTVEFKRAYA